MFSTINGFFIQIFCHLYCTLCRNSRTCPHQNHCFIDSCTGWNYTSETTNNYIHAIFFRTYKILFHETQSCKFTIFWYSYFWVQSRPEINQTIAKKFWLSICTFCPFYVQNMSEKVSKLQNADKNELEEFLTMNFRHFVLSCKPFWGSSWFLDNFP